jgi:solute carrier family 45, member 1/2/4
MTGFSSLQLEQQDSPSTTAASLSDTRLLGPRWLKLPLLTLGFLGVQVLWSVELSYGLFLP